MNLSRFIIPRIPAKALRGIALVSVAGAVIGGGFGILHDQVTYGISEEYFTRFKFNQFAYAEPPINSPRLFAGIIGFLASWWVGALTAWVLARISLSRAGELPPARKFGVAFGIVFLTSILTAIGGWGWGLWRRTTGYADGWIDWMDSLGVANRGAFMSVGYIHNASYLGGTLGMLFGILYLARDRRMRNEVSEETRESAP